ncbi:MAG: HEAT repeat domain-containing protein, partial [Candidatus Paceibacterota bacterium]
MKISTLKFCCLIILILSCFNINAQNRFSNDAELRKMYTFQYNHETDSLKKYLVHPNSEYREAACLAFASVQDSNAIVPLFNLLISEKEKQVRKAILFSLGQMKSLQNINFFKYYAIEKDI